MRIFLALAEEGEPFLLEEGFLRGGVGSTEEEWLDRLEQELDNLRGAIDWLSASREGQLVQRLAGALSEFWCGKEHVPRRSSPS